MYYGWVVVAVTFVTVLVATGARTAPPVLIHPLEREFGWDRASIAAAVSIYLLLQAATGPVQGHLMDRFGPRRILTVSLPLMAIGIGATVFMSAIWQCEIFWGVVVGVATGATTGVLNATVAARWFGRRRGFVVGVLSNASSAGQLLFFPLLMALVVASGWRSAMLVLTAALLLIVLPLVLLFMRDDPADAGLAHHPEAAAPAPARPAAASGGSAFAAMRTRDFWFLAGSMFICGATDAGLTGTHLVPYAIDRGIPEVAAASIIGVMGITNVAGSLASGWLSDRYDPRKVLALIFATRVAALALLPFLDGFTGLVVFALIFGLGWIAQGPPMTAIVVGLYGRARMGSVLGWTGPAHQVGAAGMAYLAGAIRVETGDYALAFQIAAVLVLAVTVWVLLIRDPQPARTAATTA